MLLDAVVIASDGAGADVGLVADFSVAQVGQMAGLRSGPELCILQLDEVADTCSGPDAIAASQPREWANLRIRFHLGIRNRSERSHLNTVGQLGVLDDGAGANAAILADLCPSENLLERTHD